MIVYNEIMMYDLVIIGGGPAALLAGVYAARQQLKILIVAKKIERSQTNEDHILVGEKFDQVVLGNKLLLEVLTPATAVRLDKNVVSFSLELKDGKVFYSRAVIITEKIADLEDLSSKDSFGRIKIDPYMQTNIPGLFAAGNAITIVDKDELLSAAEGARAAWSAADFFGKKKRF
jgi:NADH-dependent peroxiredoxin subunit F